MQQRVLVSITRVELSEMKTLEMETRVSLHHKSCLRTCRHHNLASGQVAGLRAQQKWQLPLQLFVLDLAAERSGSGDECVLGDLREVEPSSKGSADDL
jgi:hypothetical protein